MKLRRLMIIGLCLLILGCNQTETDNIVNESTANIEETKSIDSIEESSVDIKESEEIDENRFGFYERPSLDLIYSDPKLVTDLTKGKISIYEELINYISDTLNENAIEEVLQEKAYNPQMLSEKEIQELIQNEEYGRLENFYKITKDSKENESTWYLIEQTEQRQDVVIQQIDNEDGWTSYDIFKCKINEEGNLNARYGVPAISNTKEHYYIEYNGLKYLCTPNRSEEGIIRGIAIHIFDWQDIYGGVVYIECIDEIKIYTYWLSDGNNGNPFPSYLEE